MMLKKSYFSAFSIPIFLLSFCFSLELCAAETPSFQNNPAIEQFIEKMAHDHAFNREELKDYFQQATVQTDVLRTMDKQAESKAWYLYRDLFINPAQLKKGALFYQQYKDSLESAQKIYGVPAEIIAAIIGLETRFGSNTGKFPVFDTLSTLAFFYPRRAEFFTKELEAYLLLTREEGLDTIKLQGSFMGAMGAPQFMPSSYRQYAVDFTQSGQRNLFDMHNAIGSVAHYIKQHGWKKNAPIVHKTRVVGEKYRQVTWPMGNPKPRYSYQELVALGVRPKTLPQAHWAKEHMTLLPLQSAADRVDFWLGFDNFYVITRYNHSTHYAMAVVELSQLLKKQWIQNNDPHS